MATKTTAEESIITLREPCNELGHTRTGSVPRAKEMNKAVIKCTNKKRRKLQCRSIGSSSLLLIFTWLFIIQCSLHLTLKKILQKEKKDSSISQWFTDEALIGIATVSVSCIIASLLAEVLISRYKIVSFSLKAMWLLCIADSVISLCEESLPVDKTTLFIVEVSLCVLPQFTVLGVFIATAVPLAMDQIIGGSNVNISAFIVWLGWAFFSGVAIADILASFLYTCSNFEASKASIMISLLPVFVLSVGLISDFCFHHKLVKEPVTVNPVSLIFKVLIYAAKHKYPVQRSAFTYCENEKPTRLDYGKSKYGGPFTTEQVEDVKTFWRILLVIVVISLVTLPLSANTKLAIKNSSTSQTECTQNILNSAINCSSLVMFSIPLYELLLYPCLRNRTPNILNSTGIGAVAVVISSMYGIIAESLRPIVTHGTDNCTFLNQGKSLNAIQDIPFNILLGLTHMLLNKCYVEFICAQAPYNMNGLLIGILVSLYLLHFTLGSLLYDEWSRKMFTKLGTSTCGIWFYLTTLVLAVVSSALLGLVIRWYKARERDEITRYQDLVEEVYIRQVHQEQAQQ